MNAATLFDPCARCGARDHYDGDCKAPRCQCESNKHPEQGCPRGASALVKTVCGTFKLCDECEAEAKEWDLIDSDIQKTRE
jgi:hypothetical protein